jgi:hypothetical protein
MVYKWTRVGEQRQVTQKNSSFILWGSMFQLWKLVTYSVYLWKN